MYRKFVGLISFVLLLGLAGSTFGAQAYTWDAGAAPDYNWFEVNNWDPNGVPGVTTGAAGDSVAIGDAARDIRDPCWPVIRNDLNFPLASLLISRNSLEASLEPKLTIVSGTLAVQGSSIIGTSGSESNIVGHLTIQGGTFRPAKLWVGYKNLGYLTMTGGSIICTPSDTMAENWLEIARGDDCSGSGGLQYGDCRVHLDGGVIDCGMFFMRLTVMNCAGEVYYEESPKGWMDIRGGTLIVGGGNWWGDWRNPIQTYHDPCGWLTAYGVGDMNTGSIVTPEKARLITDYDWRNPGRTTVTAYLAGAGEAYDLDPAPYTVDVDPAGTVLTWKPGDYVKYGGLYKGLPNAQKGNGHHLFLHTNKTYVDGANLNYATGTQFGHIVGAQDANYFSIAASYPGGALKLDTLYWWCVIEVNDANVGPIQWTYKSLVQAFRTVGGKASNPNPANNATLGINAGAPLEGTLTWDRGFYAADTNGHRVYFGTNFNEVNLATPASPQYKGTQTATSYLVTALELGKKYYWRIDEVNTAGPDPCLWPGDTWTFTVGAYRVVDEFANDNNDDDLRARWKDNTIDFSCSLYGSGAILYSDTGGQTGRGMRFEYDNNDRQNEYGGNLGLSYFSEGRFEYASGTNWTYGDASTTLRALALSYRGVATNDADETYDRLYVAVESTDGNMAIVMHDDPIAQTKTTWDEWNIDLRDFSDADVNLASVKYLYIGSGVRCNETNPNGGEGTVWFDNIRLYPPRCVGKPGYRQLGDLSGNCDVNWLDVDVLSTAWLMADRITGAPVPVAGNDPNMLVRYQFEQTWANDANGRVGAAGNGVEVNNPTFVYDSSRSGYVAYFPQADTNDVVLCGTWGQDGNFAGKSFSIVFWANQKELSTETGGWGDMVAKGESYQKVEFGFVPSLERQVHCVAHSSGVIVSSNKLDLNRWYHIAETYQQFPDMNGGIMRLYIDGRQNGQNDINEIPYNQTRHPVQWADPNWSLGAQQEEGNSVSNPPTPISIQRPFHGYLDDVRVYDRQLSEEEVMYIAGVTTPNYYPIPVPYIYSDIYSPDAQGSKRVNLKDLAILAQDWMESALWPTGF